MNNIEQVTKAFEERRINEEKVLKVISKLPEDVEVYINDLKEVAIYSELDRYFEVKNIISEVFKTFIFEDIVTYLQAGDYFLMHSSVDGLDLRTTTSEEEVLKLFPSCKVIKTKPDEPMIKKLVCKLGE